MDTNNKKRLRLDELKVESFVTDQSHLNGGLNSIIYKDTEQNKLCSLITCNFLACAKQNSLWIEDCSIAVCTQPVDGCVLTYETCATWEAHVTSCHL